MCVIKTGFIRSFASFNSVNAGIKISSFSRCFILRIYTNFQALAERKRKLANPPQAVHGLIYWLIRVPVGGGSIYCLQTRQRFSFQLGLRFQRTKHNKKKSKLKKKTFSLPQTFNTAIKSSNWVTLNVLLKLHVMKLYGEHTAATDCHSVSTKLFKHSPKALVVPRCWVTAFFLSPISDPERKLEAHLHHGDSLPPHGQLKSSGLWFWNRGTDGRPPTHFFEFSKCNVWFKEI